MRPPQPPVTAPFVTFLTPTFRRPKQLAACLESVGRQTATDAIEHLVIADHRGVGLVEALFGQLPRYADACHGDYIHLLADDDTLADARVVEDVRAFAVQQQAPDVIVVNVQKGPLRLPIRPPGLPPVCGEIDLGSYLVRADVWRAHLGDYGRRYEGDFDHVQALYRAGRRFAYFPRLFLVGAQSHGRPELDY